MSLIWLLAVSNLEHTSGGQEVITTTKVNIWIQTEVVIVCCDLMMPIHIIQYKLNVHLFV